MKFLYDVNECDNEKVRVLATFGVTLFNMSSPLIDSITNQFHFSF